MKTHLPFCLPGVRARSDSQALVEFTLILPVLLIMLLGTIDLGRAYVFGVSVQQGAREAARYGAKGAIQGSIPASNYLAVRQRLVDASRPAYLDCLVAAGTTFTTTTGSSTTITNGTACTDGAGGTWTATVTYTPSVSSASSVEVKAVGNVGLLTGFATGWLGLGLDRVTVQGRMTMPVF